MFFLCLQQMILYYLLVYICDLHLGFGQIGMLGMYYYLPVWTLLLFALVCLNSMNELQFDHCWICVLSTQWRWVLGSQHNHCLVTQRARRSLTWIQCPYLAILMRPLWSEFSSGPFRYWAVASGVTCSLVRCTVIVTPPAGSEMRQAHQNEKKQKEDLNSSRIQPLSG